MVIFTFVKVFLINLGSVWTMSCEQLHLVQLFSISSAYVSGVLSFTGLGIMKRCPLQDLYNIALVVG